jgi:TPR repeat protein
MQLEAIEKSELAAEGGKCDALYNLGLMYSTGHGVDVDLVIAEAQRQAREWLSHQ